MKRKRKLFNKASTEEANEEKMEENEETNQEDAVIEKEKEEEKIPAVKSQTICPKCKSKLETDENECKYCGCKLEIYLRDDYICPSCGSNLPPMHYSCEICHYKVNREELVPKERAFSINIDKDLLIAIRDINKPIAVIEPGIYVPAKVKAVLLQNENCLILSHGFFNKRYFEQSLDIEESVYLLVFNESNAKFHFIYNDLLTNENKNISCTVYIEIEIGDFSRILEFMLKRSSRELAFEDIKEILYSKVDGLVKPVIASKSKQELVKQESKTEDEIRAQVLPRLTKLIGQTGLTLTDSQIYLDIPLSREEEQDFLFELQKKLSIPESVEHVSKEEIPKSKAVEEEVKHEEVIPPQYAKPAAQKEYLEEDNQEQKKYDEEEEPTLPQYGKKDKYDYQEYKQPLIKPQKIEFIIGKGMWVFLLVNSLLSVILITMLSYGYFSLNSKVKNETEKQIQLQEHSKLKIEALQKQLETQMQFLTDMAKNPGLYGLKMRIDRTLAKLIQNNKVGDLAHSKASRLNLTMLKLDTHLQNMRSDSVKSTMDLVQNELLLIEKIARNRVDLQTPQDMVGGIFVYNDVLFYQQSTFVFYRLPNGDTDKEFSIKGDGLISPVEYNNELWFVTSVQGKSQLMAYNFNRREIRNISLDSKSGEEELPAMEIKQISEAGDYLLAKVHEGFYVFEKPEKGSSIRLQEVWKRIDRQISSLEGEDGYAGIVGLDGSLEIFDPKDGKLLNAFMGNEVKQNSTILLYNGNIFYFHPVNGLIRRKLGAPWPIIAHMEDLKAKDGSGVFLCDKNIYAYDGTYVYNLYDNLKDFRWRYKLDAKSIHIGNQSSSGRVCVSVDERALCFINIDDYEDKNPLPDNFKDIRRKIPRNRRKP
ncbi:MAG: zinc ribbon domain-containing protein [Candidatus Coatesbacteria bacterium]|nr:zinc ribbon domain-containing protein [Candidatus Coatesbacteria bacterium]